MNEKEMLERGLHTDERGIAIDESGNEYRDEDGQDCYVDKWVCQKCGNPAIMYWCDECESNQEEKGECKNCGHANGITYLVVLDEDYHNSCN